jgi:hypothetical protein
VKQFTVTWHADVQDSLAKLVVAHWGTPQLEQISRASAQIDRLLSERPLEVGTTAGANLRVLTVPPLTVHYAVFAEDRIVSLLQYRFLPTT